MSPGEAISVRAKLSPAGGLEGSIAAPPSKSYTHRYLACSLLADGESIIEGPSICEDTSATIDACAAFGAEVKYENGALLIRSSGSLSRPEDVVYCRGSGTTLRFFTALAPLAPGISILTGDASLRRRPMLPLLQALRELGVKVFSANVGGRPPIVVFGGSLAGGRASIRGDVSSQYVSGLMIALTKARRHSVIEIKRRLESRGYVDLTLRALREFNAEVIVSSDYRLIEVEPRQELKPRKCRVPGDYSAAAFIAVAAAVVKESSVRIEGLNDGDLQPDSQIVSILANAGVDVRSGADYLEVRRASATLASFEADVRDCPDLAPPLASLACFCEGKSVIRGVSRLKYKESDRLGALFHELSRLGVNVKVGEDQLVIYGKGRVEGGVVVDSWADHRIAMALAVVGLGSDKGLVVEGFECISKSYPRFAEDIAKLGGEVQVVG